jgi:DNA-binding transcriptional ArsR family regulator
VTLKIHFTDKDLSRITMAPGPDPMWEVLLSSYRLRRPEGGRIFGQWRREARSLMPPKGKALLELIPPYGYCPDFLTPAAGCTDIDEGADALTETPVTDLHADIGELMGGRPAPLWLARVAHGEKAAVRELSQTVRQYFQRCLAPNWRYITRAVAQDRARRAEAMLVGGAQHLLATLHPAIRWRPPVLEVRFPVDQDLYLNGRGLRLVPAFFCLGMPTTFKNSELPPVLVYSIEHRAPLCSGGESDRSPTNDAALRALLGETRARMLRAIAAGDCNTSELARRARTSVSTASQHASVLRDAGLVRSHQSGKSMVHAVTSLGFGLLIGDVDGSSGRSTVDRMCHARYR